MKVVLAQKLHPQDQNTALARGERVQAVCKFVPPLYVLVHLSMRNNMYQNDVPGLRLRR